VTRGELRYVLGLLLAVAVPAALLHALVPDDERRAAALTAAPFAWPRVLVAHLVAALPLGLLAARPLRAAAHANEIPRGAWLVCGAAVVGGVALVSPGFADALSGGTFGEIPLLVLRALFALALVVPWCAWAGDERGITTRPGVAFAVATGLALVPPALYASAATAARTASANEWWATGRLAKADRALAGLCELGSARAVAEKPPGEIRRALRRELDRLESAAKFPLPPTAPPRARFARAEVLIQLDRLDEAADLLAPLAPGSPNAQMLLASVDRDHGHYVASAAGYEAVLARAVPDATQFPEARETARLAFEGLAFVARADNRPADAEAALLRALDALPRDAAHFHFLLGRHYHDGGRPVRALEHLRRAAELDARFAARAAEIELAIRTSTPACVLK
jgi:predicted Zn-dependent protease